MVVTITVKTETGTWEVKKPTARQIMTLSDIKENADNEAIMQAMGGLLNELIVNGPQEFLRDGTLDVDNLPAEDFLELFFASCGKAVQVLQKFQWRPK